MLVNAYSSIKSVFGVNKGDDLIKSIKIDENRQTDEFVDATWFVL